MVLKLAAVGDKPHARFESSVNSDGSQTANDLYFLKKGFESSVNSDGSQTSKAGKKTIQ